jgi:hypothetical protein
MFRNVFSIGSDVARVEREGDALAFDFEHVPAWRYVAHVRACSRPLYLTPKTAEALDAEGARCYLARSGAAGFFLLAGFYVGPTGELGGLFNASGVPGLGVGAFRAAEALGAAWLTCYAGHLDALYRSLGWRETAREPFAPEYAPEGWNVERDGAPDYVTMRAPYADEKGPGPDPMPDGWRPVEPETAAREALDEWAAGRAEDARLAEADAAAFEAERRDGNAEDAREDAARFRALGAYCGALLGADVLGDVLAAPALRAAAEALESAAASLDGAASLLADAEAEAVRSAVGHYSARARDAAADAANAREAARGFRERAEAAERVEREAARRAWEISKAG